MRAMLQLQQHRGPDDTGIVAVNTRERQLWEAASGHPSDFSRAANMVLGFNRLSILDLSINGHQPMLAADGRVALMLNGEIYNAFDFRAGLEAKGYRFKSRTDTEVVLNLYLEYGFARMVQKLNGMFAIALVDMRSGSLYLARDRFGIKPLYIWQTPGKLAFSSEIKSFKALPAFRFVLAQENINEFLLFRNLVNHTLFKDISNLPPGEYWHFDFNGSVEKKVFHDFATVEYEHSVNKFSAQELASSLHQSVARQLMSDVKLGCQLSGGVDSSLVSHYAAQSLPAGQLETISITFADSRFSEEPYIDYVAEQLDLKAHKYTLTADYYLNKLEAATWHFENPLNHPNTIGIYLLSAEARKHVTVLLSGEGADEIMAGYGRFAWQNEGLWSKQFLVGLKRNYRALPKFLKYYLNDDYRMVMSSVFTSLSVTQSLYPAFGFTKATAARMAMAGAIRGSGVTKHRKYEMKTYLPDLLMRQDKMSMAHSIENRVPFLDNELVSNVLGVGETSWIGYYKGKKEGKLLLKQLCASLFKEDFSYRPKMGFGIPLKEFMQTPVFKQKFYDQLLPGIQQRGIFTHTEIADWANNIGTLATDKVDGLWQMIAFEQWAQQYLDE